MYYRDYSTLTVPPADQAKDRKASSKTKNFPSKLFRLLAYVDTQKEKGEDLSGIASFDKEGRSFQIIQKKKFEEVLLTKFFNTKKYESFRKQLNVWGFKRVNNKSWYHEMFLRSKPELCQFMKRRVNSQEYDGPPPFCFDIEEPHFDEMPWLPPTIGTAGYTSSKASSSSQESVKKDYQPRLIYSRADSDNTMNTVSEAASSMHTSYNSLPPLPITSVSNTVQEQKRSLTDMMINQKEISYKRSKFSDVLHMSLPHDMKLPSASFYQEQQPRIVSDHSRADASEHMRADEADDLDTLFRRHEYEEQPLPVPSNVTLPVSSVSSKPNLDKILDFSSMEQPSSYVPRRSSSKIIDQKLLASLGLRIDTHDPFHHNSRRESFNTALKNLDDFCVSDDLPEDLTDLCNVFDEKDVEVKDQALKLTHNDHDSAVVKDWYQKLMRRSSFLSNSGSIA
ncbi:hypothetical protein CTEN210_12323 [Chaetoceros tenuissimus]|uniref:HSF-type DNA-binding domain-containing protein n=1 Tax=Chaetoceros tenuissimus TaxID=426638 RepID=A0AAD3H9R1_9STRA|nr:hypothetical protein CTEN210_12323 [Chaetoceros tenuissimus]